jgi:inner membrane protein
MPANEFPADDAGQARPGYAGKSRLNLALKAMVVAGLTVLLLIPLAMINGTIKERTFYRQQAVSKVAESFAGPQLLTGPVLVIPYSDAVQVLEKDAFGKPVMRVERSDRHWIFFPAAMSLQGKVLPSVRKLGLHEVRVYESQLVLNARFDKVIPNDPGAGVTRTVGSPYLSFSIADVRGLVGMPNLKFDHAPLALGQGLGGHRSGSGLHATLAAVVPGQRLQFTTELRATLAGTESLAIAPIADSNHIVLDSSWPHPQFAGRFLPRNRKISDRGFHAQWDISSLAAGTQGQYLDGSNETVLDSLSLSLVEPVNIYSQADRASKYGILFVMLTFVGFFMFELLKRLPIHPIQYTLVGFALAIFFLLLLSLSEHMEFWIAYLIASVACIGLQGLYLSSVLKSKLRGTGFAGGLTLLYAALYGLLISEDNALVLGSLMLFAILAALMMITRKIDWYAPGIVEGRTQGA